MCEIRFVGGVWESAGEKGVGGREFSVGTDYIVEEATGEGGYVRGRKHLPVSGGDGFVNEVWVCDGGPMIGVLGVGGGDKERFELGSGRF